MSYSPPTSILGIKNDKIANRHVLKREYKAISYYGHISRWERCSGLSLLDSLFRFASSCLKDIPILDLLPLLMPPSYTTVCLCLTSRREVQPLSARVYHSLALSVSLCVVDAKKRQKSPSKEYPIPVMGTTKFEPPIILS